MKKVTAWYSYETKMWIKQWCFNHIEDGWDHGFKPKPKFPLQKCWNGKKWKKEFCYIDENQVVKSV